MFKKVLVAEDMDSVNHAVVSVLKDLGIEQVEHAPYCDQAWLMARKALQDGKPFDLLICDLFFKSDHRDEKISSGKELIAILRKEDPSLKDLVNYIEDNPGTVKSLWESGDIQAYVCKDRNGMRQLRDAIIEMERGNSYSSPGIQDALREDNLFVLDEFEMNLLNFIANGFTQDEIQEKLKEKNISPSSKSSIEKRLKELREEFNANTTPHLIGIVKDLKLI